MLQLLWNMFKETGQVNTYILYKAFESSGQEESFANSLMGGDDGSNQVLPEEIL